MTGSEFIRDSFRLCEEAAQKVKAAGGTPAEAPKWQGRGPNPSNLGDFRAAVEQYVADCNAQVETLTGKLKLDLGNSFAELAERGAKYCQQAADKVKQAGGTPGKQPSMKDTKGRLVGVSQYQFAVEQYVKDCNETVALLRGNPVPSQAATPPPKAGFFAHEPRLVRLTKAGGIDHKAKHPLTKDELHAIGASLTSPHDQRSLSEHYSFCLPHKGSCGTVMLRDYPGEMPSYVAASVKAAAYPQAAAPGAPFFQRLAEAVRPVEQAPAKVEAAPSAPITVAEHFAAKAKLNPYEQRRYHAHFFDRGQLRANPGVYRPVAEIAADFAQIADPAQRSAFYKANKNALHIADMIARTSTK